MDNQRLLVWAAFGLMLWLTFQAWQKDYGPQPIDTPPAAADPAAAESLGSAELLPELAAPDAAADDLPGLEPDSPAAAAAVTDGDAGALIVVETDVVRNEISIRGGSILAATMLNYPVAKDRPDELVRLLNPTLDDLGLLRTGLRSSGPAPDHEALSKAEGERFDLGSDDELRVPLVWTSADGVEVTKTFIFRRGHYAVDVEQQVVNGSSEPWSADQYSQVLRRSYKQERSMFDVGSYSFDGALLFDGSKADKLDRKDLIEEAATFTGPGAYFAAIQQHFLIAVIPPREATH